MKVSSEPTSEARRKVVDSREARALAVDVVEPPSLDLGTASKGQKTSGAYLCAAYVAVMIQRPAKGTTFFGSRTTTSRACTRHQATRTLFILFSQLKCTFLSMMTKSQVTKRKATFKSP